MFAFENFEKASENKVMKRMPIAVFAVRAHAQPIVARLRQAGISAETHDELHLEKLWFVRKGAPGVRLEVPAEQFESGEQLLLDWDSAEGGLEAIRCPECRSFRVHFPQFARHSLLTNLAMGLLASLRFLEKEYYCEDCHFTWPREGTALRRNRPHMAPYYFIEGIEQTRRKTTPEQPLEIQKAA